MTGDDGRDGPGRRTGRDGGGRPVAGEGDGRPVAGSKSGGDGDGGDPPVRDATDVILEQWRHERPDLDLSLMGPLGRLWQLAQLLEPRVNSVFTRHGLRRGEFDVLTALRRAGEPYTLIPSELADTLMMSRAGMTNRIDRLEAAGLVERRLDPADRRSFLVALTERGREVIDETMTEHAANLQRLVASVPAEQIEALDGALRTLLRGLGAK
ncbi:MarR family transcriptional regulator [Micromonospora sp. NPDC049559]|uniref:MarR family winged helix-turn-helix transcriptional regulator n=1 Tax=Micromonospora sp. NPDC049559 TaxID=3155923 RepID=UPI003428405E